MTEETQQSQPADSAFCPSCERFIGPADTCPYCDADSARGSVHRILRLAALILGVGGLAFLYFAAISRELPVIQIGDITPMMNFAHVRVSGTVVRDAFVGRRDDAVDYISFTIDDGTGRIPVAAYKKVAEIIMARKVIPTKGADVDVSGTLSVSANGVMRLRLQSAAEMGVRQPTDTTARRGQEKQVGWLKGLFGRRAAGKPAEEPPPPEPPGKAEKAEKVEKTREVEKTEKNEQTRTGEGDE